jgi:hypothetical protein
MRGHCIETQVRQEVRAFVSEIPSLDQLYPCLYRLGAGKVPETVEMVEKMNGIDTGRETVICHNPYAASTLSDFPST